MAKLPFRLPLPAAGRIRLPSPGKLRFPRRRKSREGGENSWVVPTIIVTVLAIASGTGLGLHLAGVTEASDQAPQVAPRAAASLIDNSNPRVKKLPPIVTNLAEPAEMWARLEATIVFAEPLPDNNTQATQISEDVLAFLKTLRLSQIEGPSNFQHLREDLRDRVAIRSGGQVSDLIIESLVVQ